MTLAPDSITIPDAASGLEHAGKNVSSKYHPVVMLADADGHLQGTAQTYIFYQTPRVTTAAATDFFDLFNATGSGKVIRIRGIWSVQIMTIATAFIPPWEFSVIRTSAIGTAGTAAAFEGAAAPAAGAGNVARLSTADAVTPLPTGVTIRTLPTGGATSASFWFNIPLCTEEVNAATYLAQSINFLPTLPFATAFELQENQGMKIRQITAVASTGTAFGWLVAFAVIP